MAVGKIWNVNWLNANAQRNYPLHDASSGWDTSGSFRLPTDFLVDLNFPAHMLTTGDVLLDLNNFCVRNVTVFAEGASITLAYYDATSDQYTDIAERTVLASAHTVNKSYYLEGLDAAGAPFFDSIGKITIGIFDTILQSGGSFTFDLAGGCLLPTVIRPALQTLRGIQFSNADGDVSDLLQGDVILEAGMNVQFDINGNIVTIHSTPDSDFVEPCACDTAPQGPPIRTINGIQPDETGNFQLEAVDCIRITPISNGLRLDDTCAQPCCGCSELEAIQTQVETLATQLNNLDSYANRVHGFIQQLQNVVLASNISRNPDCPPAT